MRRLTGNNCNYRKGWPLMSLSVLSIAMATKENMTSQRGMLKSIQSRVNTLASILSHGCVWSLGVWCSDAFPNTRPSWDRFPTINNLIQRINLRKRRDSLILGSVIGICTILLLLYALHWRQHLDDTLKDWCALLRHDDPDQTGGGGGGAGCGVGGGGALDLDGVLCSGATSANMNPWTLTDHHPARG